MKTYVLSCLVFLALGTCFPSESSPYVDKDLRDILDNTMSLNVLNEGLKSYIPEFFASPTRAKKSEDVDSLLSVAKELQGFGKERAGFRFRFGRQDGSSPGSDKKWSNDLLDLLFPSPSTDSWKRSGSLGSLAEELNGYNRKKGGFSFRFGKK
ncbi:orexigenic neuropeptide QRFP [Protopterus annectens]|uniref:orexigenic neuropeptide QRFP n=1 Tax=Protopterus annectens TaxID=7888 RepID=UPI001CFBEE2D|nr:orexigenic neuropeptide QRFP [Protopterus annectens]